MEKLPDGEINRSSLSLNLRYSLKSKEKEMGKTCRKLWIFTNPKGNRFIFGWFKEKGTPRGEGVVVTVSQIM